MEEPSCSKSLEPSGQEVEVSEIIIPLTLFGNSHWMLHQLDRDGDNIEVLAQYVSSQDECFYSEEHMDALRLSLHELLVANKLMPLTALVVAEYDKENQLLNMSDRKDFYLNYSILPFRKWFIVYIRGRHPYPYKFCV